MGDGLAVIIRQEGVAMTAPFEATGSVERMAVDSKAPTAPLDEFLAAYKDDDNWWWRIGCGHHQNLFDAAIYRMREIGDQPS